LTTDIDDDAPEFHHWRAPNGSPIVGTSELTPGMAEVTFHEDGTWDYAGETDVYWDGQTTVTWAGQIVWQDQDGNEWRESELLKDPTAPALDDWPELWADPSLVRAHAHQVLTELLTLVAGEPDRSEQGDIAAITTEITHLAMKVRNRKASTT